MGAHKTKPADSINEINGFESLLAETEGFEPSMRV